MIKTDKVIYRTRTLEEYNWLMTELDEEGCRWNEGGQPRPGRVLFGDFLTDTCIRLENKKIFYMYFAFYNGNPDFKDYEIIEVSDIMKKPLKTDKVIYHTKTQEEFDWLMEQLQEADCEWQGGGSPISGKEVCDSTKSNSYIWVGNKTISFSDEDYLYDYMDNLDYEIIEVSDLMENEEESEILDKLEDLKRIENEFKNIEKEDDKSQKIKKIVYTTEVYFE